MGGRDGEAEARREIAGVRVGSWVDMAPRLGLVVRRPWPGRIGCGIGRAAMLVVAIEFGEGLGVVTERELRRWSVDETVAFTVASANTRQAVAAAFERRIGVDGARIEVTALAGGPFTSGAIAGLRPGQLAIPVSDELVIIATPIGAVDAPILGVVLAPLVAAAVSFGDGGAGWPPIVRCGSDGRLAIFDPRSKR